MTPLLLAVLCRELKETLLSSRLSHIAQSANETVELSFYHPDRPNRLLVASILPKNPFLFLASEKRPALQKPPNFCRSLRKHLEYAQVEDIRYKTGERILTFLLKTHEGTYPLVFEGIPKYPNLILVGPDGLIISALRYKEEVERPVLPQVPYASPPQPLEKPNFWGLKRSELETLWEKAEKPALAGWIRNSFRGTDPELAAFLDRFGPNAFDQWEHLKEEILERGWGHFTLFAGPPPSLKIFPESTPSKMERQSFPTASQALERLLFLEFHLGQLASAKTKLETDIAKALKHEKRIVEKLKKDRAEAEKADQYQWWGELVMSQLHKIKLHSSQANLEDLVRGTKSVVPVPLDPEITPLKNAQRFFKKAQKGSRGLSQVEKREKEIKDRIDLLKAAQRSLPALKDVLEIRKAHRDLFPAKKEAPAKPKKAVEAKTPTPNILREKIGKEFEICAGASAVANEYVTFQLAQPEDLWFHVRDLPGSHVILRRLQRNAQATEELILKAAQMAASHSKAAPGSKVTVIYTEKKNVKRIPGAPMGMVSLTKEKSLFIDLGRLGEGGSEDIV